MSTDDLLLGLGLVIVLAVGSQLLAGRLRLPAIVMLDAISRETELEDVTDALLLTANDDFNALAALALRTELGHGRVYRAAPDLDETDLLAPAGEQGILGTDVLTSAELGRRFAAGARLVEGPVNGGGSDGELALFVVTADGGLRVASAGKSPPVKPSDGVIALVGAG